MQNSVAAPAMCAQNVLLGLLPGARALHTVALSAQPLIEHDPCSAHSCNTCSGY